MQESKLITIRPNKLINGRAELKRIIDELSRSAPIKNTAISGRKSFLLSLQRVRAKRVNKTKTLRQKTLDITVPFVKLLPSHVRTKSFRDTLITDYYRTQKFRREKLSVDRFESFSEIIVICGKQRNSTEGNT